MVRRDSGLLVPTTFVPGQRDWPPAPAPDDLFRDSHLLVAAEPPSDLDAMFVAPDPEALGQRNPSLPAICDTLRTVPVEPAIFGLAGIAAACWHAGTDQKKHMGLAEEIFAGRPVLDLLQRFVASDPHHIVFSEQHLTILTRLLLVHGREGQAHVDMTNEEVDALLTAMLAVGGLTERLGQPNQADGDRGEGWVPWLVRAGLYFDRSNLGNDQARARALFVELAAEADPASPNWLDLRGWAEADLVSIPGQFVYGYATAALSKALDEDVPTQDRFGGVATENLFGTSNLSARLNNLVRASSATRDEFLRMFEEEDDVDHLLWDRTPFEQRPFLRARDGRLVLISPRFLHSWMGEGAYYRLLDAARQRPDPDRPTTLATLRFTRFHGELMERYVHRLADRAHADQRRAGIVEITGERTYTGRRGTEQRTPDLVLSYTTDLIAVEVTGGRPSRRTRVLSDPALVEKELDDRVISKLEELDAALVDVLDGTADLSPITLDHVERVWPVLIVPSTIIQSDFLWNHIRECSPNLFTHHQALQPPTLFSVEDFERALAAVETGAGLPAILAARLSSPYIQMPPSHFFRRHYRAHRRPAYLDEQFSLLTEEARSEIATPGAG